MEIAAIAMKKPIQWIGFFIYVFSESSSRQLPLALIVMRVSRQPD
jgi:hypothetical protein